MINKKELDIFKKVKCNEKIRPIINKILINNNKITATDLTTTIISNTKTNIAGVFDIDQILYNSYEKSDDNVEDYPIINQKNYDNMLSIDKKQLLDLLEVHFASEKIGENEAINSVFISCKDNIISFVSSDSYRIMKKEIKVNNTLNFSCNIPLKTIKILIDVLKLNKKDEDIIIAFDNNNIEFTIDNIIIISRLILLCFPDFANIYEQYSYNKTLIFDKKEIELVLKNIKEISKKNHHKYGFLIESICNNISFKANNDIVVIDEKIECTKFNTQNDFSINLNCNFILQYIKQSKKNKIKFELDEKENVVLIDDCYLMIAIMKKN